MSDADRPLSFQTNPIWLALLSYTIGPEDAALSFEQRLARENGWTMAHVERVMLEYKRLCYLAVTCDHPVTPSDAVDQAWHLHLTYTRDYWQRFCPNILGRDLHHGPTEGGSAEDDRFFNQYAVTMRSYERVFGEAAPHDLWPNAAQRLREDPKARRVHPRDGWIIGKWRVAVAAAMMVALMSIGWFH